VEAFGFNGAEPLGSYSLRTNRRYCPLMATVKWLWLSF